LLHDLVCDWQQLHPHLCDDETTGQSAAKIGAEISSKRLPNPGRERQL
jgi:hypothetical protein